MIKTYCDICGKPALDTTFISEGSHNYHYANSKIGRRKFKFQLNGMLWTNSSTCYWGFFHVCKKCLSEIILNIYEEKIC